MKAMLFDLQLFYFYFQGWDLATLFIQCEQSNSYVRILSMLIIMEINYFAFSPSIITE